MGSSNSQHATVEKIIQQKCWLLVNFMLTFWPDNEVGKFCPRRLEKSQHGTVEKFFSQQLMLRNWFDRRRGGVGGPCRCVTRWTSVFLRLGEVEWGVIDFICINWKSSSNALPCSLSSFLFKFNWFIIKPIKLAYIWTKSSLLNLNWK